MQINNNIISIFQGFLYMALTQKQYIDRCLNVFGNKYDYSEVEYKNTKSPITIICPIHGTFKKEAGEFLRSKGCYKCHTERKRLQHKEIFINKANEIHKNKYDYSKMKYKSHIHKILIICPIHGEFYQTPSNHLNYGCRDCGYDKNRIKTSEFIETSRKIHNNFYTYDKTEYISSSHKVTITCPFHGNFKQRPINHLNGMGCVKCCNEKMRLPYETFLKRAKLKHGNKYDYSKVKILNSKTKITIICPIHGEFKQSIPTHLNGYGCSKCSGKNKWTLSDFIKKATQIHGNKYDYSKVKSVLSTKIITIICPKHGEFKQILSNHIKGYGCHKCKSSLGETKIMSYLETHKIKYISEKTFHDLKLYNNLKFDFYIPKFKMCIEFDGPQHFMPANFKKFSLPPTKRDVETFFKTIRRDSIKNDYCKNNNLKILRIPYWEINNIHNILDEHFKEQPH